MKALGAFLYTYLMRGVFLNFLLGALLLAPIFAHSAGAHHQGLAHQKAPASLTPLLSISESQAPSDSGCWACEVERFEESSKDLASLDAGTVVFDGPILNPFQWTQNPQGRISDLFGRLHSGLSPPQFI